METKISEIHIPLGKGQFAVVDFKDWNKVNDRSWGPARGRGQVIYAQSKRRSEKPVTKLLHRVVWGYENIPSGFEIAHLDGDGLNCRKENLRCLTHKQNLQGRQAKRKGCSSIYRGVSWSKFHNFWAATVSGAHIGFFEKETDAARAYDAAAIKYFGAHAAPNFPTQKETICEN